MGPVAQGLVGPRLLSEEEDETEPLRAETALGVLPEATHCDCLHAARVACRDDLSGKAPLSIPTTFSNTNYYQIKTHTGLHPISKTCIVCIVYNEKETATSWQHVCATANITILSKTKFFRISERMFLNATCKALSGILVLCLRLSTYKSPTGEQHITWVMFRNGPYL